MELDKALSVGMGQSDDRHRAQRGPLSLSERERECMGLAAQEFSDRQIGEKIGLSEKTVDEYIQRVKHKLDVSSRVEAIVWSVKLGLIKV